jgi:hypothetical protein
MSNAVKGDVKTHGQAVLLLRQSFQMKFPQNQKMLIVKFNTTSLTQLKKKRRLLYTLLFIHPCNYEPMSGRLPAWAS